MANHPSAAKRARQSLVRRDRNRSVRTGVRTAIKKVEAAVAAGDKTAATSALTHATSVIARATSKGVLHANTAGRRVSRLHLLVNHIS